MANTRPDQHYIDPNRAIDLSIGAGERQRAQDIARRLVKENSDLIKLLGLLLERTGPVELTRADLEDAGRLYQIERYDSADGLDVRWVSRRVAG